MWDIALVLTMSLSPLELELFNEFLPFAFEFTQGGGH
jgi:hypothetical protein